MHTLVNYRYFLNSKYLNFSKHLLYCIYTHTYTHKTFVSYRYILNSKYFIFSNHLLALHCIYTHSLSLLFKLEIFKFFETLHLHTHTKRSLVIRYILNTSKYLIFSKHLLITLHLHTYKTLVSYCYFEIFNFFGSFTCITLHLYTKHSLVIVTF